MEFSKSSWAQVLVEKSAEEIVMEIAAEKEEIVSMIVMEEEEESVTKIVVEEVIVEMVEIRTLYFFASSFFLRKIVAVART